MSVGYKDKNKPHRRNIQTLTKAISTEEHGEVVGFRIINYYQRYFCSISIEDAYNNLLNTLFTQMSNDKKTCYQDYSQNG